MAIVAAVAANGVIGRDGDMPWRLPEDLKRFKRLTTGGVLVMGRRTHESIGRALPDRENLVVTRHPERLFDGAEAAPSLDAALDRAAGRYTEAFVVGGEQLYRAALPRADRLYLTLLDDPVKGDTYFPPLPQEGFRETHRERPAGALPHSFVVWERTSLASAQGD